MITLGLVDSVDDNGVYVTMPGSRGVLRGPYKALSTVAAGTTVLVASTDDGEQVVAGAIGGGVTPQAFGAKADGTTDDTVALQAFFDYIAANDVGTAHCSGTFKVSAALNLGDGEVATKHISGRMVLEATAAIDTVLTINGFGHGMWDGEVNVKGTGGASYASRTCRVGLYVTGSGRAVFGKIRCRNFNQYGVLVSSENSGPTTGSNTTLVDLGSVTVTDIGSGYPGGSNLTSSWSNPVQSGTSGSNSQTVTIDVTTLPPESEGPQCVLIAGETHFITSVDTPGSTVTLFPWIDSALSSGTLEYIVGAGVLVIGPNAGVVNAEQIDATRCSVGLWSASLYGPVIKRLVTQACIVGVALGRGPSNSNVTTVVEGLYCELNSVDLLRVSRAVLQALISIHTFDFSKVQYTCAARVSSTNAPTPAHANLSSVVMTAQGGLLQSVRQPRNYAEAVSTLTLPIAGVSNGSATLERPLICRRDSWTVSLVAPDMDVHHAFGETARTVVFIGTGTNGAPTGTFTFNAPSGYTVNGGSSAAFSGFTGPATFHVYWVYDTADIEIHCLNAAKSGSKTFDPPSVSAGAQTTTTVTVTGATVGDYVRVSFNQDLQAMSLSGYVSAADTVTAVFHNNTGSAVDLASGTLSAQTFKV